MTTAVGTDTGSTLFRITLDGTYSVVYTFGTNALDGSEPFGGVIQAGDGSFYGMTAAGGANSHGTIFRVTPTGQYTVLYSFTGRLPDASHPGGSLIQAADGRFYGVAAGGAYNLGVVFSFAAP